MQLKLRTLFHRQSQALTLTRCRNQTTRPRTALNSIALPLDVFIISVGIVNYNEQTLSSGSFNLSGAISKQSIATGRKGSEGKDAAVVSQIPKPKLDPFSMRFVFLIRSLVVKNGTPIGGRNNKDLQALPAKQHPTAAAAAAATTNLNVTSIDTPVFGDTVASQPGQSEGSGKLSFTMPMNKALGLSQEELPQKTDRSPPQTKAQQGIVASIESTLPAPQEPLFNPVRPIQAFTCTSLSRLTISKRRSHAN